MSREDEHVLWQMRKVGYDLNKTEGVEFAEQQYDFLVWLQYLYDHNCLKGNFYTNNIIKEIWDTVRKTPSPLQVLDAGHDEMERAFMITISEDDLSKEKSCNFSDTGVN